MTEWIDKKILLNGQGAGEYMFELKLPDFLASWDVWEYWERSRFMSMANHLEKDDVLFDIGAESGWMTAIFGKYFVHPHNVAIFEPTPEYWPNIRETWMQNCAAPPRATYCGLVGMETKNNPEIIGSEWPTPALGPLSPARSYKYIHEHGETAPQISIDTVVFGSVMIPDAMTIDVEGAELLVLRGAERTLIEKKPMVWVSIHPDLMLQNYKTSAGELHAFMDLVDYKSDYLGTDHESHWLFQPR